MWRPNVDFTVRHYQEAAFPHLPFASDRHGIQVKPYIFTHLSVKVIKPSLIRCSRQLKTFVLLKVASSVQDPLPKCFGLI